MILIQYSYCKCSYLEWRNQIGMHNLLKIDLFNPKQPLCKKSVRPSKRLWWKKMWNPRWRPRNGCDGRLMVKILITTIQVNLVPLGQLAQNSPELSLLKFLPLTYHHNHFLAATLDFTSFFTIAFWGPHTFFTAWLFWIRFHFFLYCIPQSRPMACFGTFLTYLFFFTTGKRKDEADVP